MSSPLIHHLNFLPENKKRSGFSFSLSYFWMLLIFTLFAVSAASFSLYQKHRLGSMQAQVERITEENTQNRAAQAKGQQEKLSESARKEALGDPIFWSKLLKGVMSRIPDAVKLGQLTGTITNKRVMSVRGNSSFLLPIFRLKDSFGSLKECVKPSLVNIEQAQNNNAEEQLSFQMECTLL
jgi:hypothetical protein